MRFITADFETYYDKEYSLSKLSTEAYVRDPRFEVIGVSVKVDNEPPQWFSGTMEETAVFLSGFDIPNSFLLAHNTAFDGFILSHHFGLVPRFYFDTLSMARPKHQMTVGGSLKALSEHYTIGIKGDEVMLALGKHRLDFTPEELARYGRYCSNDVQLCYMLFHIMKKDLPMGEMRVIDLLLRMHIDPVLELDRELLAGHLTSVVERKALLLSKVQEVAGKDVLMSNPKLAALLQARGIEPPMKPSPANPEKMTYAFSKADQAFKALLEHPDPIVQAIVSARLGVKSTLEETRTKTFINISERGTLPVPLGYYKAHTGRAAGEDGINLQNLPRGGALRRAIKAPDGHKIVAADSSQIEARIVAWLAGQDDLVAAFAAGVDIYSGFASEIYNRRVDRKMKVVGPDGKKFSPDEKEGFVGKTCILGLGFGMGPTKFQTALKAGIGGPSVALETQEAKRIVYLYRNKYTKIPDLWNSGDRALQAIVRGERYAFGRNGLLYTSGEGVHLPNGMLVRYPGLTFDRGEFFYASDRKEQAEWVRQRLAGRYEPDKLTRIYGAKVIENVVQALARIIVFEQMLAIARRFRVVLTVHDEVVSCVLAALAESAREFMVQQMSTPPVWAPGLPVACEAHIGERYGEAK